MSNNNNDLNNKSNNNNLNSIGDRIINSILSFYSDESLSNIEKTINENLDEVSKDATKFILDQYENQKKEEFIKYYNQFPMLSIGLTTILPIVFPIRIFNYRPLVLSVIGFVSSCNHFYPGFLHASIINLYKKNDNNNNTNTNNFNNNN